MPEYQKQNITFQSVVHLLLNTADNLPDKNALLYKKNGQYTAMSYRELKNAIEKLTGGLASIGLKPGDRIAILSYNRPEWSISDFAIFALRGISVPVYHTLPPGQIAYILKDAGVRAVFVEDQLQYEKIMQIWDDCPNLKMIFPFFDKPDNAQNIFSFQELLELGENHKAQQPEFFSESVSAIQPEETCSIVYTSGTTGEPKGVMLHHKGFIFDIISSESVLHLFPEDVFLSFLPLSHLYERLAGHWCAMYRGCTIAYADDITTVVEDIQQIKPTVLVSVPRLYEKISNAVIEQVEAVPALKRKLFYWALKTGRRYNERKLNNRLNPLISLKYAFADRVVFSKIKQKLGGRFRHPISGGAPISTETIKFFEALGIRIVEGYGMTETHLIITLTPAGKTRYGSCGKPIPGVEVRIAEDGEILVKGPTLMKGYYHKPELTRQIIDPEGWLHTGDIGHLESGYLFITDRKKNIIVTAGGKNISPAQIENALKQSRYIEDVCLVGNGRRFVSAVVVPQYENLKQWAMERKIPFTSQSDLMKKKEIRDLIAAELETLQVNFARYEKAKKFLLLPEPLTVENGELTPSLKIKRAVVEKKYKDLIDSLYEE